MSKIIWILGPGGAGNSALVNAVFGINHLLVRGVDLDMFGYRTHDNGVKRWIYEPTIFNLYGKISRNWQRLTVLAGACSNVKEAVSTARDNGIECKVLLTSDADELRKQREYRGDDLAKVNNAEESFDNWTAIAKELDMEIIGVDDFLTQLHKLVRTQR